MIYKLESNMYVHVYIYFTKNMEEGCNKENVYEDIPPSKPIQIEKMPGETEPLIRAQSDGSAESNEPQLGSHNAQTPPTSSSPVTPQAAAVELTESTGALSEARQLQHHPFPGVPAPPLGNQPQYATVNKFQNSQVTHQYACLVKKVCSKCSLVPRLSRGRRKRAWYTLFAHALNIPAFRYFRNPLGYSPYISCSSRHRTSKPQTIACYLS